jgi:hypothetical protein
MEPSETTTAIRGKSTRVAEKEESMMTRGSIGAFPRQRTLIGSRLCRL